MSSCSVSDIGVTGVEDRIGDSHLPSGNENVGDVQEIAHNYKGDFSVSRDSTFPLDRCTLGVISISL